MKKKSNCLGWLLLAALIAGWFVAPGMARDPAPFKVRALKDNTNLRAKPALNFEVVGQAAANQELTARSMDAEWVEVAAPANIDFYVLGDYLKDNVVVCRQPVNVRAGPGINFSIVGQLTNGAMVKARGTVIDWVKIAPPEGCSLWVARPLVEIVASAPVKPPPAAPPIVRPAAAPAETRKPETATAPKPAVAPSLPPVSKGGEKQVKAEVTFVPPADLDLVPGVVQGELKQCEGVLRSSNFLVRSPSGFRLVTQDPDGRSRTVCFVRGNRAQLDALLFRELIISGRQYWVRRCRPPVLVPAKIILK